MQQIEAQKIAFYQYHLQQGGVQAWALHLAQHPEDSRLVMTSMRDDQLRMIQAQMDLVKDLLHGDNAEKFELEGPKQLALRTVSDILNQRLPGVPQTPPPLRRPPGDPYAAYGQGAPGAPRSRDSSGQAVPPRTTPVRAPRPRPRQPEPADQPRPGAPGAAGSPARRPYPGAPRPRPGTAARRTRAARLPRPHHPRLRPAHAPAVPAAVHRARPRAPTALPRPPPGSRPRGTAAPRRSPSSRSHRWTETGRRPR